jgi:hypothetical protein
VCPSLYSRGRRSWYTRIQETSNGSKESPSPSLQATTLGALSIGDSGRRQGWNSSTHFATGKLQVSLVGAGAVAIVPSIFNLINSHLSLLLYLVPIELVLLGGRAGSNDRRIAGFTPERNQLLWQITGEFGWGRCRCHDSIDSQSYPLPPINIALLHTD